MKPVALPAPPAQTERRDGAPWPIAEAAAFFNRSVRSLTRDAAEGKLKLIKLGRLVYVPDAEMRRIANDGM
jgi:hypothetical protein